MDNNEKCIITLEIRHDDKLILERKIELTLFHVDDLGYCSDNPEHARYIDCPFQRDSDSSKLSTNTGQLDFDKFLNHDVIIYKHSKYIIVNEYTKLDIMTRVTQAQELSCKYNDFNNDEYDHIIMAIINKYYSHIKSRIDNDIKFKLDKAPSSIHLLLSELQQVIDYASTITSLVVFSGSNFDVACINKFTELERLNYYNGYNILLEDMSKIKSVVIGYDDSHGKKSGCKIILRRLPMLVDFEIVYVTDTLKMINDYGLSGGGSDFDEHYQNLFLADSLILKNLPMIKSLKKIQLGFNRIRISNMPALVKFYHFLTVHSIKITGTPILTDLWTGYDDNYNELDNVDEWQTIYDMVEENKAR